MEFFTSLHIAVHAATPEEAAVLASDSIGGCASHLTWIVEQDDEHVGPEPIVPDSVRSTVLRGRLTLLDGGRAEGFE